MSTGIIGRNNFSRDPGWGAKYVPGLGKIQLKNSRGSVILPVIALAATVIGEARKT